MTSITFWKLNLREKLENIILDTIYTIIYLKNVFDFLLSILKYKPLHIHSFYVMMMRYKHINRVLIL